MKTRMDAAGRIRIPKVLRQALGVVAAPEKALHPLTAEQVRETLERVRR